MTDNAGVIRRLLPQVQPYAWGSLTAMGELLGIPSTGGPMAELWFGDHPLLPSQVAPNPVKTYPAISSPITSGSVISSPVTSGSVVSSPATSDSAASGSCSIDAASDGGPSAGMSGSTPVGLDEMLQANPQAWFNAGPTRAGEPNKNSLQFLLKVMAIADPLSLQTHPNKAQAEAGFAREDALGLDRSAANRNYRDANHKPELICALTTMDALSGFRPVEETLALLSLVDHPASLFLADSLSHGLDAALRDSLNGLIFPEAQATASFALAASKAADHHPEHALTLDWWAALCDRHPGDGGVAVATLLHCVRLQPGQALFLAAGNMHAYLSGVGIEIMANSDNVLRGGLTPKHIDVQELLHVTNAVAGPLPLVEPVDVSSKIFFPRVGGQGVNDANGWVGEEWLVPVDDFRLVRATGHSTEPRNVAIEVRPLIVLCTEGVIQLSQGPDLVLLVRGESAVIGNSESSLFLSGSGTAFLASAG
jgi:mannose-6-phosphate isomerase